MMSLNVVCRLINDISNLANAAICGVETEALEADESTSYANEAASFEDRIVLLVLCNRPDFESARETS